MADTKLKRAMRERGVTAEQLADRLGMQGAALRRYVRGEIKPNIALAQQIAQALEMDEGELWDVATTANNGRRYNKRRQSKYINQCLHDYKGLRYVYRTHLLSFSNLNIE